MGSRFIYGRVKSKPTREDITYVTSKLITRLDTKWPHNLCANEDLYVYIDIYGSIQINILFHTHASQWSGIFKSP